MAEENTNYIDVSNVHMVASPHGTGFTSPTAWNIARKPETDFATTITPVYAKLIDSDVDRIADAVVAKLAQRDRSLQGLDS